MNWLSGVIQPSTVCNFLSTEPLYQQQRDRVAAIVHEGFAYWDQYQRARPFIFAGAVGLTLFSGYLWTVRGLMKRKRGYRVPEANVMYPVVMAASAAVAWVTRPDSLLPPAQPRLTSTEEGGFMQWVDSKVTTLRQQDRDFANKVFGRLVAAPGVAGVWAQTPETARVFVTCGRR